MDDRQMSELLADAVADVEPADRLDEIRDRTAASPRRGRWYAGGGLLVAAAAVTVVAAVTTQDTPRVHDAQPLTPPAPTTAVAVYYPGGSPAGQRLYREFHQLENASPAAALAELATSPQDPDYATLWAPGDLLGATVVRDVIEVAVSDSALPPRASEQLDQLALEQVIYTVQAAAGEPLPVQFVRDGNPVAEVRGRPTSEPLAASAQLDVLALVSISDPADGLVVEDSFVARGRASVFEGTVLWGLQDSSGQVVREGFTTAGMDDHLVPWKTEPIAVSDLAPGVYTFVASESDPSGGEGRAVFTDTRTVVVE